MNGNIVKLVFQTVMAGSGFAQASAQTSELSKKMGKMAQGAAVLGQAFGGIGSTIGNALSSFLQGGIWGAAAHVAVMGIEKISGAVKKYKTLMEDAKLAEKGWSREMFTPEYASKGYQRRLEYYRKQAEAAEKAEQKASEKKQKAIETFLEKQKKAASYALEMAAAEAKITQEKLKANLASENELVRLKAKIKLMMTTANLNVKAADDKVYFLAKHGTEEEMNFAKKDLELAKVQKDNTLLEAKQLVAEYRKKKELEEEAVEKRMIEMQREDAMREEQERRQKEAAEVKGKIEQKYAEAVARIESQIEAKKKEAADLEANAARARGKSFSEWAHDERDREKDKRTEARKQANREKSVDQEIERLEKTNPRTRTDWQKNRLRKLREWKADQNPNNNPALKELNALEKKRDKLLEDQVKKLDAIEKLLQGATTL